MERTHRHTLGICIRPMELMSNPARHRHALRVLLHVTSALAAGTMGRTLGAQSAAAHYVNPPGLVKPAGYTHVVVAADQRTVYIAGQVANDSTGRVIGIGDFRAQAEQVYLNLRRAVESVGGTMADLVKTTTFVTDLAQIGVLREVRTRHLDATRPPANTLIPVPVLARAELLLEIEAIAVLRKAYSP
jgi:enamine deaminase RidA (YjgF/YER057c/UK114 family)